MAPDDAMTLANGTVVAADVLVLVALGSLRTREARSWLDAWLVSFALALGVHLAAWAGAASALAWPRAVAFVAAFGASGFLLRGVDQLLGRGLLRWWLAVGAAGTVLSVGLAGLGYGFGLAAGPSVLVLCIGYGMAGVSLLRTDMGGRWLAGGGMLAFGLHLLDFPVVDRYPWLLPWAFALGGWLQLLIGFGVALLHLDRTRAEAAAAKEELAQVLERAVVGVYRTSPTEGFLFANPALVAMLGYASEEEVLQLRVTEQLYLDPDERGRIRRDASGEPISGYEATWRRADGSPLVVALDGREVRGPDGEVLYWEGFARDVTETRMLEQELARSQRMEALGRLAGGVAHDFNNLLTVIAGNLEMLDAEGLGSDRGFLQAAEGAVDQAADLTRQLLSLGRPVDGPGVVDAREVLSETSLLLERTAGPSVRMEVVLPQRSCWVPLPKPRLLQVVMNLALNARDAMPDGGVIRAALAVESDGERVVLTVADEGEGMAPDVVAHVFEPFFTTRAQGGGTGLGLATAYAAVKEAGGAITVESQVGGGSTFRVIFPRAEAPESSFPPEQVGGDELRAVVYVVDDQEPVRELVVRVLERAGYVVRSSNDPVAALQDILDTPPDLLLSDVVMPGMTGPRLVAELRARGLDVPVLFMSGYPRPGDSQEPLPGKLLAKPFRPQALEQAVLKVLRPRGRSEAPDPTDR